MPLMSTEFYFFQDHCDPTTAFYYRRHHEKVIKYRRISTTSHPSMSTFRNRSVSFEVRRVHTWRSVKSHSHSFPQYRASRTRVPLQPLAHQSCTPPYLKTETNDTVWSLTFPPSQYHSMAELSFQIQKVARFERFFDRFPDVSSELRKHAGQSAFEHWQRGGLYSDSKRRKRVSPSRASSKWRRVRHRRGNTNKTYKCNGRCISHGWSSVWPVNRCGLGLAVFENVHGRRV